MDFLNDKKNQPIIIAVVVAIILGVAFFYYQMMFKPKAPAAAPAATTTQTTPAPQDPAAASGGMAQPGAVSGTPDPMAAPAPDPGAGAAGTPVAALDQTPRPLEKGVADPFKPPYKPKAARTVVRVPEYIPYPTYRIVPKKVVINPLPGLTVQETDQTPRRMAGLLYNGSISAILETGTESVVVKPGDYVENRTMRVEKIEPGRIVLKSLNSPTPRFVEVKMAAATNLVSSSVTAPPPSSPSRPRPPGRGVQAQPSVPLP